MPTKRKIRCAFLVGSLFAAVAPGFAQTTSADSASLHVAGSDALMIQGLDIGGQSMRVYIAADDAGVWSVTAVESDSSSYLPSDVILDTAQLQQIDDRTLEIRDIFLDGQFFTGIVTFSPDLSEVQDVAFRMTPPPQVESNPLISGLVQAYGLDAVLGEPIIGSRGDEARASVDEARGSDDAQGIGVTDPDTESEADAGRSRADVELLAEIVEANNKMSSRLDGMEMQITAIVDSVAALSRHIESFSEPGLDLPWNGDARIDSAAPTLSLARARAVFDRNEVLRLDTGTAVRGSWDVFGPRAAEQRDPAERFGKLELVYEQDSRPNLYRLVGRALDDGWAGFGLHIAVRNVQSSSGYGHGQSVLVWLTRDAEANGTDTTFLEVYVSEDDVNMDRVAQAVLGTELSDPHGLEILFDPAAGILTTAVNGVEYLRYRLLVPQGASMELALRSLGRVRIEDLDARSPR